MLVLTKGVDSRLLVPSVSNTRRAAGFALAWVLMLRGALSFSCLLVGLPWLISCGSKERPPTYDPFVNLVQGTQEVPNPEVPHERLPATLNTFEETACAVIVPDFVTQCGEVSVPESPGSERTLKLAVVRVFTDSETPQPDPVVYLEGGPGGAVVGQVDRAYEIFSDMVPDRDMIFLDQRGTGLSSPALKCTEDGDIGTALDQCFSRHEKETDLSAYNSRNNANDVDLVRQAFGYEEWNLFGISYGTRLGLTVMRDHPEGVRSAILDSVVPPQQDLFPRFGSNVFQSLERVFAACDADSECSEKYPSPLVTLQSLVQELNAEPADVEGLEVNGESVMVLVFNLLYSPSAIEVLPLLIDEMAGGDLSVFENFEFVQAGSSIAFGMHLSVQCAEELPFSELASFDENDQAVPAEFREAFSGRDYLEYCSHWPVSAADPIENRPIVSDIPTLLLAGHFDPVTPPSFAEQALDTLSSGQLFVLDNQSHGASTTFCSQSIGGQFLHAPTEPISGSCTLSLPSLEFQSQTGGRSAVRHAGEQVEMRTSAPSEVEWGQILAEVEERRSARLYLTR